MGTSEDILERRCPRLGGDVTFRYCRTCGEEQSACFKVLDCWWESFDVAAFFRDRTGEGPPHGTGSSPRNHCKEKVSSLLELVDRAKRRLTQTAVP